MVLLKFINAELSSKEINGGSIRYYEGLKKYLGEEYFLGFY